jgi:hypothetical protein
MLGAMDTRTRLYRLAPALGMALLLAAPAAPAAVSMEGEVLLDYYVAEVDAEGYEFVDAAFYVERIANTSSSAAGPLSVAAWLTDQASPSGVGTDVADADVGFIPGSSDLLDFEDTVAADDAVPGEYYAHVLLQDDSAPGTYEDSRTLSPRMLWRGGLEAVGPLDVYRYGFANSLSVDFAQLRNRRTDDAVTNDIQLTLYATHGFGPASSGHTLCSVRVSGLYAGDYRHQPGFDCFPASIPDGDYTLHLQVEEVNGRAGYSVLSGGDVTFYGGKLDDGYDDDGYYEEGSVYVAGGLGPWMLLMLALSALMFRRSQS